MKRAFPIWIVIAVCTFLQAARGEPPASQPSPPVRKHPGPPVIGVHIAQPLVLQCMSDLENDESGKAIATLRAVVKKHPGMAMEQLNEVRLGLGIALLRAGDTKEARKFLLPLMKVKNPPELARSAEVVHDIAVQSVGEIPKDSKKYCDPDLWAGLFSRAMARMTAQVQQIHGDIGKQLTQRKWKIAVTSLEKCELLMARAQAIEVETVAVAQRDLIKFHADMLATEVRQFKTLIATLSKEISELGGQMALRYDSRTKQRGYVPGQAVLRYNAAIDELTRVNEMAEQWVSTYDRLVAAQNGALKRDVTARLLRTNIPARRTAFGR